jgi:DNA helicase IV
VPAGDEELSREQAYVATLYERLDELRAQTASALREVRLSNPGGTHQNRSERDAFATRHEDRLAQLNAVDAGLCFGRLDFDSDERYHIGRIGLTTERYDMLLVDWRAPAAQAFYRATAAEALGIQRRRHLHTRGRAVLAVSDEVFDLAALSEADRATLSGEAALLAAVSAERTGRMGDIVATIQSEQDRVIRAGVNGVLVVQGGPGTGKTAVALHRAAYLLYTHRQRLRGSGVLVVGPNPVFLRYIEQVLPALGETGVLRATPAELLPAVDAVGTESESVAAVKGDLRMAEVIAAAVRGLQRVPAQDVTLRWELHELRLTRADFNAARSAARRSRREHNRSSGAYARVLVDALISQLPSDVDGVGREGRRGEQWLRQALLSTDEVQAALDESWPRRTPEELLRELYADPSVARSLRPEERALLARPAGAPWTPADVPLLDEARVLLGDPAQDVRTAQPPRDRDEALAYAEGVLQLTDLADLGLVDASMLADRWSGDRPQGTLVERAIDDPDWTFGHLIVDEAQELSAMTWRMLVRRCPSRSMTLVGDLAQTGSAAGARSWAEVLRPFAGDRWTQAELSVNYRTPAEIMAVAADVLASIDPALSAPSSVRESGEQPWACRVDAGDLAAAVGRAAAAEAATVGSGRVAVLVPAALAADVGAAVLAAVPGAATGAAALDAQVGVFTVAEAKGLEFDAVLVVEPATIAGGSRHGGNDLYVALTRATRRLGVLHSLDLPASLHRLTHAPQPVSTG